MDPKTRLDVSTEEAAAIRKRVQSVQSYESVFGTARLATPDDAPAMLKLFEDECVSAPVYTLPRPFSLESVRDWIADHERQREAGVGLLMCAYGAHGQLASVSDFQFWPQWSACEFGGVIAAELQSQGYGGRGIKELCDWCFDTIGVRLLAMTSALDNIRSHKIFTHMGFTEMGEIDSIRPDGSIRRSIYWELVKE